ncbi:pirin family protein [Photobacterium nomapromontoriensis]|uniref:pirin family protein n=1 Tax=Photobacterium nomapromontoriensis TaxID=2910237 RepID=UPI003D0C42D9
MGQTRSVHKIRFGKRTGLLTAFIDNSEIEQLNPFMLWDHFAVKANHSAIGLNYHGHSGIDTISYPTIGKLNHHDSTGNHDLLLSGDVHIMTTGNGIIHKDVMTPQNGHAESFSLWTALPAGTSEMKSAFSRTIKASQLPLLEENNTITKVIVGNYKGAISPAHYSNPITYLDIMIAPYDVWHFIPDNNQTTGFVYLQSGCVYISGSQLHHHQMATLYPSSLPIEIRTGHIAARMFVIVGEPLNQSFFTSASSVHSSAQNMSKSTQIIANLMVLKK